MRMRSKQGQADDVREIRQEEWEEPQFSSPPDSLLHAQQQQEEEKEVDVEGRVFGQV